MLATYLADAGLLSRNELDAAQALALRAKAQGEPLAVADALVQLGFLSAPVLMALTFLQKLDLATADGTMQMLERYLLQSDALTASELVCARAAQASALARGCRLSLAAALVRECKITREVLDQRLARTLSPESPV